MTTSLAILPRQPALRQSDTSSQRPQLRLDTQQVRTFGKGSSLRLDTLSAVSPTIRNTFSNAYEAAPASAAPALGRPSKPKLSINSSFPEAQSQSSATTPSSASTLASALTSASSNESATIRIPYKQPHNLTSILTNSPARQLLPRKMTTTRPLFPAEKKVSFRLPLEEEITTTKYTMAHSDLESSVSSSSTITSIGSSDSDSASHHSVTSTSTVDIPSSPAEPTKPAAFASLEGSPRPKGPRLGDKRDSSESESDSDSAPETPVAGRRKRRRDWRWTLGPLPSDGKSSSSTTSEATDEEST